MPPLNAYIHLTFAVIFGPCSVLNFNLPLSRPDIKPPTATPMTSNTESSGSTLVATSTYTFKLNLVSPFNSDYLTIALGPIDTQLFGEYNVTVDWYFEMDLEGKLTPMQTLHKLMTQEENLAYVDAAISSLTNSSDETLPVITWNEKNPTTFTVSVTNSSSPFLLASTITYDEGWVAELNGTPLEHIQVNGLFSGWVVPQTGDFDIELTYQPQQYANLFATVSTVSIVLLIATVLLLYILRHKKQL